MSRLPAASHDLPNLDPTANAAAVESASRRNPLHVIWQRLWIIVGCAVIALVGAAVYVYNTKPVYRGDARLWVQQAGLKTMGIDAMTAGLQMSNFLQTQCEIIRSPEVLNRVAARPEVASMETLRDAGSVADRLQAIVTAVSSQRSDIITVSVRSANRREAAELTNLVVDAFSRYQADSSKTRASATRELLESTKRDREAALIARQKNRQEFQVRNADLNFGEGGNPVMRRLDELSGALTQIELDQVRLTADYEATKLMLKDPQKIQQLVNSPGFISATSALRSELRQLNKQLSQLSGTYGEGSSLKTGATAAAKALRDEISDEEKSAAEAYVAELGSKLDAVKQRYAETTKLLGEQQKKVLQYNNKAAEFYGIDADIRRIEQNIVAMDDQMKTAQMAESASNVTSVNVIEKAQESRAPQVEPNITYVFAVWMIIGLGTGLGLAFLLDIADGRLRSADEIKAVIQLPMLGVVPHIVNAKTAAQRGQVLQFEPMSDVAEAYRTVRTAVYFGTPGGAAKTILVTSPAPGDGKTTLASNLAIAMAQAGNRILLLDADFRKPMQHKVFELTSKAGLSSVLAGDVELADAIQSAKTPGLSILPCGPIPANPSEILNSQMFADTLDELGRQYDHVIIDSPPIMPVTDARILAASADVTLLALRAEKSTRKGAIYSRDTLRSVGARILGVVVNDVPRRKGVYGYYYSDSEIYSYGYGRKSGAATNGSARTGNDIVVTEKARDAG